MHSVLNQKSFILSARIVAYYKWLTEERREYIMSKQILRSGTSIGANIAEAKYAVSRADFINKLQIAVKEAAETEYWLALLECTGFYLQEFDDLKMLLDETKRILVSSLKTTKAKERNI